MKQLRGIILLSGIMFLCVCYAQKPVTHWNFDSADARDSGPFKFNGVLRNIKFYEGVNCTKGAWFNGDSSYIDYGNILDTLFSKGTYSITAWVYPQSYSDNKNLYSIILSKWNVSTDTLNTFILGLDKFFSNSKRKYFSPIQLNAWTHIAVVLNNNTLSIFKNGILIAQDTNYKSYSCSKSLMIGAHSNGNYLFKGGMDDIRIYDTILNHEKIEDIMHENIFAGQYLCNTDNFIDTEVAIGPEMISNYSYKWNNGAVSSPINLSSSYSTSKKLVLEVNASDECVLIDSAIVTWHTKGDNQVAHWDFNDSIELLKQGAEIKNATVDDDGVICSKSFRYNGKNTHINLGDTLNSLFIGNEFTISLWVNLEDTVDVDGNYSVILQKWDSTGKKDNSFYLSVERFQFADDIAKKAIYFDVPEPGKWHHYVILRQLSETRVYIDNKLAGSCFNGTINSSNMPLLVGAFIDNSHNLKGKADELKIYNRAISEFEISSLYDGARIHNLNTLEDIKVSYLESAFIDAGAGYDSYLWSDGKTTQSNIIENITSSINKITVVAFKDEVCYSDTASIVMLNSTRKILKGNGYKIWPCPATYEIQVSFDSEVPSEIEVLSMQGQILTSVYPKAMFSRIDINNLNSGYYLLRIYLKESIITEKIIVAN